MSNDDYYASLHEDATRAIHQEVMKEEALKRIQEAIAKYSEEIISSIIIIEEDEYASVQACLNRIKAANSCIQDALVSWAELEESE